MSLTIRFEKNSDVWLLLSEHFKNEKWQTLYSHSLLERGTTEFLDTISEGSDTLEYYISDTHLPGSTIYLEKIEYPLAVEVYALSDEMQAVSHTAFTAHIPSSSKTFHIWLPPRIKDLFAGQFPSNLYMVRR